ncbi:glycoside hydrolase family 93 protein [Trematosphaeria pertusa]|uniref:Glycoside hydrolase family 93 protein n=1 Tax=Trematosphaeria pertusa TaxID=390896 RepID=A0A6A6ICD5_9PLEO|nr:glycoside hydrolase family 93 protein [Trematosphaeria pertusa]KAF2247909.1 glycoside hydrolase family 93 protein [Trematosphaeria pertusa]
MATSKIATAGPTGDLITFGQEPNSGYPRAITTSDGTLLATYRWNDDTIMKIVVKSSQDQGATWTDPVDVISWARAKSDLNNPFLFQRSSGELLCAYKRYLYDNGALWQINLDVSQSTDGGKSWSRIGSIVSEPNEAILGEWEPFLREASDGTLEAYYAHEFNGADQDVVKRTSTDGGANWSDITTVAGAGLTDERDGMPQVVALEDGTLMLVYESNSGSRGSERPIRVWASTSSDGGATWVDPHIIFDPGQGQAGGPGIVNVPGLLVVSFMTNQDQPDGDYSDPTLQYVDMKVITSGDGGATWSPPTKVIPQAGWGGVTAVEGGVMVLAATHDQTVVMQKFT